MAKMDAFNLKRLKEEQEKALIQTDNQLEQWNKFRSDYVALQKRLKTLPNKTTHEVMVPFGSLAFMPGQLVHTNEILVLLGDNYFVERSAVEAVDIVSRRLKGLDKNIEGLQKQREMLTPQTQFASEMFELASGEGERQEIAEEYDEEREKQWRERHREYLRQAGDKQRKKHEEKEKQRKKDEVKTDADYWDILDTLEQQESQQGELESIEDDPCKQLPEQKQSTFIDGDDKLAENEGEASSHDDSDHTEDEYSTGDEEEEDVQHSRKTITFSHTKHHDGSPSRGSAPQNEDATDVINSPADLYRLVKTGPKSILKTPSQDADSHSQRMRRMSLEDQKKVTFGGEQIGGRNTCAKSLPGENADMRDGFAGNGNVQRGGFTSKTVVQACSDTVVERRISAVSAQPPSDSTTTSSAISEAQEMAASDRPVSKFRASRQKADTVPVVSPATHSQDQMEPHVSGAALQSSARPVSKFRASRVKQGGNS